MKGGSFVVKIFMGPDVGELLKGMRPRFARVTSFKPQSSRVESKETFRRAGLQGERGGRRPGLTVHAVPAMTLFLV